MLKVQYSYRYKILPEKDIKQLKCHKKQLLFNSFQDILAKLQVVLNTRDL